LTVARTVLTWFSDTDTDVPALELCAGQVECLLQTIDGAKLDVAETLGLTIHLVLDNAHIGNLAVGEEVVYVTLGGVEGQVTQMSSVGGL
jgi:hypothetical protein